MIDSREEQVTGKTNTAITAKSAQQNTSINQTQEVVKQQQSEKIGKEDELDVSQKSNPAQVTTS